MSVGALTDCLQETLAHFDVAGPPQTTSEIADSLGIGRRSTYERLDRLVDHGYLETKKVGASARVWWHSGSPSTADRPADSSVRSAAATSLVDDVLDGAEVGVFVLDENFEVAWINEATERYFGIDRDRALGRDKRRLIEEHIAPSIADSASFADRVRATYEDNTYPERFECRVTQEDGREERWLEHRSKPIESGAFAGGRVELYYDVTARRDSQRRLEREREIIDQILETSPVGIAIFSPDGSIDRANDRMAKLFGTSTEEFQDRPPGEWKLLDEDGTAIPFEERPVGQVLKTGESVYEQELRIQRLDGRWRWVSINAVPLSEDGEDHDRVISVAADVTRLKEQAQQLERQRDELESELQDVFDRISDGFYGLDEELQFTYVNDRAEAILDIEESSAVGRDIRNVLPIDEGFEAVLREALEEQIPVFFEDYSEPLDTWFANAIYPSDTGLSIYFRDVTDRKEREQELERYAGIMDAVGEPVYELDERGQVMFVNEPFVEWSGYSEAELLGEHVAKWVPEETVERAESKLRELLADDESGSASLEYELLSKGGDRIPVVNRFTLLTNDDGGVRGSAGVLRDVSERVERERKLEESERRYRTLVENVPDGAVVLFDEDLRYITVGGENLDRLGLSAEELEGNRVQDALPDEFAEQLLPHYRATVEEEERCIFGVEYDGRHLHLRTLPVRDDDGEVVAGMAMAQDVTRRIERERKIENQREELAALNNLNDIIRQITDAVIDQSTREEIETTVCDHLAGADSYEFAWIGDVDSTSETVEMRTEVGVEGYLDDVTISVDPDDERSDGPTGRALRSGKIQTTRNIHDDARYDPWRDRVAAYGFQSSAAVPIVHEDATYGVLNVYADRPNAFEGQERAVISQLGEVVGHAIAAAERKRALLSDDVVELQYRARGAFEALDVETAGEIVFQDALPVEDDKFFVYGSASETAVDGLRALVEEHDHWTGVAFRDGDTDVPFKLRLRRPPVLSLLASVGGTIAEARIEDGDWDVTLHVPPSIDVRRITETMRATYPSMRLLKRRQTARRDEASDLAPTVPTTELTNRQRVALEAAYYEGYFEWPRKRSGTDIAASLGVSSPTFHQHLRKAEQAVFDSLLGASASKP